MANKAADAMGQYGVNSLGSKDRTDMSNVMASGDNESVGVESSYRFQGRGSDFQGASPKNFAARNFSGVDSNMNTAGKNLAQSFGSGYYKQQSSI
jgi:hypothetical protein